MGDESDDSDEWGMEELPDLPLKSANKDDKEDIVESADNDADDWLTPAPAPPTAAAANSSSKEKQPPKKADDDRPMIIIDMTKLTKERIHSKFDRNSVNDSEGASVLRKKIESSYDQYAKDPELVQDGTVIPCGMSVWRDALSRLRDERPGHYFSPIFPPK